MTKCKNTKTKYCIGQRVIFRPTGLLCEIDATAASCYEILYRVVSVVDGSPKPLLSAWASENNLEEVAAK